MPPLIIQRRGTIFTDYLITNGVVTSVIVTLLVGFMVGPCVGNRELLSVCVVDRIRNGHPPPEVADGEVSTLTYPLFTCLRYADECEQPFDDEDPLDLITDLVFSKQRPFTEPPPYQSIALNIFYYLTISKQVKRQICYDLLHNIIRMMMYGEY